MQLKRFTMVLLSLILIWTKTYAEISGSQIYDDSVYRQLLVIWDDVNYRTEPAGKVIDRLDSGETLLWIGELRSEDELWYHTISEVHGEGYIVAKYVTPIIYSESIKLGSPLDDNLLDFYKEYYLLQIKYGFLIPDEANASFVYSWDEALDFDNAIVELAMLLDAHSLIPMTEDSSLPYIDHDALDQRVYAAKKIVKEHYGTDKLWEIFARSTIGGCDIQYEDWHSPILPYSEDKIKLDKVREVIRREYGMNSSD